MIILALQFSLLGDASLSHLIISKYVSQGGGSFTVFYSPQEALQYMFDINMLIFLVSIFITLMKVE